MDSSFKERREFALLEAERLRELGNIEQEQGNYGEALLGNMGVVYHVQGEYERAIEVFTQAVELNIALSGTLEPEAIQ